MNCTSPPRQAARDEPSRSPRAALSLRWPLRLALLIAPLALVAGCGDDDPVEPAAMPPDLSGSYTLVSLSSAIVTGGEPLTPPQATGGFTLQQTSVEGGEAMGTLQISLMVPESPLGSQIQDTGVYTNRLDGTWEQIANGILQQAIGTYSLANGRLTVTVTEPALAASVTVWQRQ